jgi:hypothetical protein
MEAQGRWASSTQLVAGNGVEIVLACMENHTESTNIQKMACEVLVRLFGCCSRDAWTGGVRSFHEFPRGINAILAAVQRYPDDVGVQEAAMSTFFPLQQCAVWNADRNADGSRPGRHAEFLMNAGGMPLLFLALERHNTSYEVVIGALSGIHHIVSEEADFSDMY